MTEQQRVSCLTLDLSQKNLEALNFLGLSKVKESHSVSSLGLHTGLLTLANDHVGQPRKNKTEQTTKDSDEGAALLPCCR